MKVKIKLLKPFSDIAGKGELDLEFPGGSAIQALNKICESYPDLRNELFEDAQCDDRVVDSANGGHGVHTMYATFQIVYNGQTFNTHFKSP